MAQEQNSTKSGSADDAGGVVILALVACIGLPALLATRRPWLYEQGLLEDPNEWWPLTVLGWLVAIGLGPDPRVVDTLTPAMSRGRKVVFHHAPEDLLGAVQA